LLPAADLERPLSGYSAFDAVGLRLFVRFSGDRYGGARLPI